MLYNKKFPGIRSVFENPTDTATENTSKDLLILSLCAIYNDQECIYAIKKALYNFSTVQL